MTIRAAALPTVGAECCLERTGPADLWPCVRETQACLCSRSWHIYIEVHAGSSWYELRLGIRIFVQFPMGSQCWVKIKVTVSPMGTFLVYWQEKNPRKESPMLVDIHNEYSWDERKFYSGLFLHPLVSGGRRGPDSSIRNSLNLVSGVRNGSCSLQPQNSGGRFGVQRK